MMRHIKDMRWSIIVVAFLTLLLSQIIAPLILEVRQNLIDNEPVVKMQGRVITRTTDSVAIMMWGEKLRACTFVKMSAYTIVDGVMRDANLKGPDGQQSGTRPLGVFNLGVWTVWPTIGAKKVSVFVQHDCHGKVVITNIAEVDL